MPIRRYISIVFFLSCLASCSIHPSSHWIMREQLLPSSDPNIEVIELVDGPVLEFNHSLGWYDAEKGIIEGVTITGGRYSIPLARVQRLEIEDKNDRGISGILAILLICVAFAVAGVLYFISWVPRGGCMVAIISIGMMVAVIIILI